MRIKLLIITGLYTIATYSSYSQNCAYKSSTQCSYGDSGVQLVTCISYTRICTPVIPIICVTIPTIEPKALTWVIGDGFKPDCALGLRTGGDHCKFGAATVCSWTYSYEQCDGSMEQGTATSPDITYSVEGKCGG